MTDFKLDEICHSAQNIAALYLGEFVSQFNVIITALFVFVLTYDEAQVTLVRMKAQEVDLTYSRRASFELLMTAKISIVFGRILGFIGFSFLIW